MSTEAIFYGALSLIALAAFVWVAVTLIDRLEGDELDGEQP